MDANERELEMELWLPELGVRHRVMHGVPVLLFCWYMFPVCPSTLFSLN